MKNMSTIDCNGIITKNYDYHLIQNHSTNLRRKLIKLIYHQMLRKFDYLQEKQEQEPYNFIQEPIEFEQILEPINNFTQYRKKTRIMHATIQTHETIHLDKNIKRENYQAQLQHKTSEQERRENYETKRDNLIYHKTIDKYREQFYRMRIKEGLKQISSNRRYHITPSLSNKKSSAMSQKQACSLQRKLKNRLNQIQAAKLHSKINNPIQPSSQNYLREEVREGLVSRINQINKIVNSDAKNINLIHEIDPMDQMQRIRFISEHGHKQMKLTIEPENDNIELSIFQIRQLMRKYLHNQQ